MNIGERLREEREKLRYSQEKLGAIGGVQKRAQINYESGERQPDAAYLRGVAQVGVDVQYVLLGVRSANLMEVFISDDFVNETNSERARKVLADVRERGGPPTLPTDEQALLDSYRRCKPEARINLIQMAALLAAGLAPPAATPAGEVPQRDINMVSNKSSGAQVGVNSGTVTDKRKAAKFEGSQQIFQKAPKGDVSGRDIVKGEGKR